MRMTLYLYNNASMYSYAKATHPVHRVCSTGKFEGLKLAIFDHFCDVLVTYKRNTPLNIGLFSLQGVGNSREKGVNPPIGGKKYTLIQLVVLKRQKHLDVHQFNWSTN